MSVFISYAKEDADFALKLYDELAAVRLSPWMDKDLLPGQDWKNEVEKAIRLSSFFVALLSLRFVTKTGYVQKEIRLALEMSQRNPQNKIFIIPVRLDDCEVEDGPLAHLHFVDLFENYEEGLQKLIAALKGEPEMRNGREVDIISLIRSIGSGRRC